MKAKYILVILTIAAFCSIIFSCSTTKVLKEDEYMLDKVNVTVENDPKFNTNSLQTYIQQKPNPTLAFGLRPLVSIYNWAGDNDDGWSRFIKKFGKEPVVYDKSQVKVSVDNLERHLEYLGWYNSKVNTIVKIKDKKASVGYLVSLGTRFVIDSISFNLPSRGEFAADFLADTSAVTIHKGDFLSESALEDETERATEHFRQIGYFDFNKSYFFFEADTLKTPGHASLVMTVKEYTRNESEEEAEPIRKFAFGNVSLNHPENLKIDEKILKNLNLIHPGDKYSEGIVNTTYNRLSAMRLFSGVNISLSRNDSTTVDCDINLTPSKIQGFKFDLEGSTNSTGLLGVSPELSYFNKNLFRGGEWLNLSFMGNFQFMPNASTHSTEYGVSSSISLPRFVFLPYSLFKGQIPRTEFKVSYNYQNRPEYQRNIVSTSFSYNGMLFKKMQFQLYPLQANIVRLFDIDPIFWMSLTNNPFMKNAYQDHFDIGSGGDLYYTTNSSVNPKTSYHYAKFQFDVAGNVLSLFNGLMAKDETGSRTLWETPYSQYIRGELTLGKTWVFGKDDDHAIATRVLAGAGYAYGNSTTLPFEQRFYSGGSNSLRGWQSRSVGPGLSKADTSFVIPNQSGDMKLEGNIEYRFPVFWKLNGAVFVDAGNVWNYKEDTDAQSYTSVFRLSDLGESIAMDWGLGIRLDLSVILVRLDLGMILHDPAQEPGDRWRAPDKWIKKNGYALHFGVGYPF